METKELPGELPMFTDMKANLQVDGAVHLEGHLSCSTFRLTFKPSKPLPLPVRHLPPSFATIPVTAVRKIKRLRSRAGMTGMELECRDLRCLRFYFADEVTCGQAWERLCIAAFPPSPVHLQALAAAPKNKPRPPPAAAAAAAARGPVTVVRASPVLPGWTTYNALTEFMRQGVSDARYSEDGPLSFRQTLINRNYEYSPSYPAALIVPSPFSDGDLSRMREFRSRGRIPALTWRHPVNGTAMWRCAQPRVGPMNNSNKADQVLFRLIRFASGPTANELLIADCRPRANAYANKAAGWGYVSYPDTQHEFLSIHNIHTMRDSIRKLEKLCWPSWQAPSSATAAVATSAVCGAATGSPDDLDWGGRVEKTGWLAHVRSVLNGAWVVAHALERDNRSVVVHCSDGWDRTSQVCGLAQLLMDSYYRTLEGFMVLICKDWLSFGHKFMQRLATAKDLGEGGKAEAECSPVFLQFLDCVWQLVRAMPHAFAFNERLPLAIAHHLHSNRFGTFLFDCERERRAAGLDRRSPSLWDHLERHKLLFVNPLYLEPQPRSVLPLHRAAILRPVTLWEDFFLRYSPVPSGQPSLLAAAHLTSLARCLHLPAAAATNSHATAAIAQAASCRSSGLATSRDRYEAMLWALSEEPAAAAGQEDDQAGQEDDQAGQEEDEDGEALGPASTLAAAGGGQMAAAGPVDPEAAAAVADVAASDAAARAAEEELAGPDEGLEDDAEAVAAAAAAADEGSPLADAPSPTVASGATE